MTEGRSFRDSGCAGSHHQSCTRMRKVLILARTTNSIESSCFGSLVSMMRRHMTCFMLLSASAPSSFSASSSVSSHLMLTEFQVFRICCMRVVFFGGASEAAFLASGWGSPASAAPEPSPSVSAVLRSAVESVAFSSGIISILPALESPEEISTLFGSAFDSPRSSEPLVDTASLPSSFVSSAIGTLLSTSGMASADFGSRGFPGGGGCCCISAVSGRGAAAEASVMAACSPGRMIVGSSTGVVVGPTSLAGCVAKVSIPNVLPTGGDSTLSPVVRAWGSFASPGLSAASPPWGPDGDAALMVSDGESTTVRILDRGIGACGVLDGGLTSSRLVPFVSASLGGAPLAHLA